MTSPKILPQQQDVKVGDITVTVRALTLRQLRDGKDAFGKVVNTLVSQAVQYTDLRAAGKTIDTEFVFHLLGVIPGLSEGLDQLIGQEPGFCDGLSFTELTTIIVAFLEVNDVETIVKNALRVKNLMVTPVLTGQ